MPIRVDEAQLEKCGRPAGIVLGLHTLRAMERWQREVPDTDCAMIMIAVVAITSERLLRSGLDPEMSRLTTPIDPALLAKCNVSSIAHATGVNRETARRKVNDLVQQGLLARSEDGNISLRPGLVQEPAMRELITDQLTEIASAVSQLLKMGVLTVTD